MSKDKFVKDVWLVACTNILISAGQLAFLPVVAKHLGSSGYGIWAQINATLGLIGLVATLGLDFSFVRFYSSTDDREKLGRGFFTLLGFILCWSSLVGGLVFFFSGPFSGFVFGDRNLAILARTMAVIIPVSSLNALFFFFFRARRRIKAYSIFSALQVFGDLALISFSIAIMGWGVDSIPLSMLVVRGVLAVVLLCIICKDIFWAKPVFSDMPEYLKFSLPLIPSEMANWITNYSDRYLIIFFLGIDSAGVYAAAYGIGRMISAFALPLNFVLVPALSRLYDNGDIETLKKYLSQSFKYLFLGAIPAVFGLWALSKPILRILTKPDFVSGYYVIPIVGAAMLFVCANVIFGQIFVLVKKSHIQGGLSVAASLLNFLLNLFAVPYMGILGAALSTLVAFAFSTILTVYFTRGFIKFDLEWDVVAKSLMASAFMVLIVFLLKPVSVIGLSSSVFTGAVIYLALIFVFGALSSREIAFFRGAIKI